MKDLSKEHVEAGDQWSNIPKTYFSIKSSELSTDAPLPPDQRLLL